MRNHFLRAAAGATEPETGWDISKATFNGTPVNFFGVATQETAPTGLFFKPDGTKMYVLGDSGNDVNEYDLSSAWDIATASYVRNKSVSSQDGFPNGLFFKPDGTKMYVIGSVNDAVYEYNLSTAWNISTASYLQNFSVATEENNPQGLFFKPDGTKMYVCGTSGDDVNEYDLSTAWDISTVSYLQNFSVKTQESTPRSLFFKPDGTKMYVLGSSGDDINEYDLSSAWDVSTASYLQTSISMANIGENNPTTVFFKPDGSKAYIAGTAKASVFKFDLSTAWDVSTISYAFPSTEFFNVGTQSPSAADIFFKTDGTKMYVLSDGYNSVREYGLSSDWDIATASYLQGFSIGSQESSARGLFFKPDGTKMYVTGTGGDNVNEYDLSTAWDVSTASYLQNFSVSAQEIDPTSVSFKPDGTKMYVLGNAGDDVNEYDLSTAWNISTASYLQNFSVGAQENSPQSLFFKPDGTKMYITGTTGDDVNQYNLSSAWDISTASYLQNFSVADITTFPTGLFFKPDGTKMYIEGGDLLWSYDL